MGDCIMAFWNAPVENPKHAELAVEAAKRMMKTIYRVNEKVQEERPNICLLYTSPSPRDS